MDSSRDSTFGTHRSRLPDPAVPAAHVPRGIALWACARGVHTVAQAFTWDGMGPQPLFAPPDGAAAAMLLTVVLGQVDVRRAGQRVLLANLGISLPTHAALLAALAGACELALWGATALAGRR